MDDRERSAAIEDWLSNTASKGTISPPRLLSPAVENSVGQEQTTGEAVVERTVATERTRSRPREECIRERRRSNGGTRRGGSTYRPNYGLAPDTRRRDAEQVDRPFRVHSPRHEISRQPSSHESRRDIDTAGYPHYEYGWDRRPA